MANVLYEIMGKVGLEIGDSVKKLDGVKGKAEDTSDAISGNKRSLSERMNNFGKGAKKVGGQLSSTGKTMTKGFTAPLLGVGGALLAGATKMGNMADELLDLSAITGMSTDSLQEWRHVADVAGVSQDTVADSARRMTERMDKLGEQTDDNTQLFGALGISQDEWLESSQDDRMTNVITGLADMEDGMERNMLAQEFFGKGWKDMAPILDMTSDEIENLNLEAHDLNKVMGEEGLNDANDFRVEMGALKDEFMVVGREIMTKFMPILKEEILPLIRDQVVPFVTMLAEKISGLAEWFTSLSPGMKGVVVGFIALLAAIGPIMGVLGPLISLVGMLATANWAMLAPLLLKVAVFAAIVVAIVLLIKHWRTLLDFFMTFIKHVVEGLAHLVSMVKEFLVEQIKKAIDRFMAICSFASDLVGKVVGSIVQFFSNLASGAKKWVVDEIQKAIDRFMAIWTAASGFVTGIVDGFINGFVNMKDSIARTWESVTSIFKRSIDAIKGFFNFKFKWPNIPMPRFGINPSGWKIGDLLKGSIPKLDIKWNAAGGIFDSPTLFNTANAGMQGVGEAGPEAIIPLNSRTLGGIGNGVAANMPRQDEAIVAELRGMREDMKREQKEFIIEMDKREVGRAIRDEVDKGLGQKSRGRRAAKGK